MDNLAGFLSVSHTKCLPCLIKHFLPLTFKIQLRANIFSSGWIDLAATVGMREMEVFDKDGAGIPPGEFLRILNKLDEDEPNAASFRFAVVVGEDNKPRLQMQSLPASAVLLSGKALLKG